MTDTKCRKCGEMTWTSYAVADTGLCDNCREQEETR